jgi:hypothetical protein
VIEILLFDDLKAKEITLSWDALFTKNSIRDRSLFSSRTHHTKNQTPPMQMLPEKTTIEQIRITPNIRQPLIFISLTPVSYIPKKSIVYKLLVIESQQTHNCLFSNA